jgi:hypothetical protein
MDYTFPDESATLWYEQPYCYCFVLWIEQLPEPIDESKFGNESRKSEISI